MSVVPPGSTRLEPSRRKTSTSPKFEGLKISQELPKQIGGLFHAGSVGIIMSGWLGAMNYGVIVANDVDGFLMKSGAVPPAHGAGPYGTDKAMIDNAATSEAAPT